MKIYSLTIFVVLLSQSFAKDYDFTGRVVLTTGSSSGIGRGIAKRFAQLGANVVITGRNATEVQSVAKECLQLSPKGLKVCKAFTYNFYKIALSFIITNTLVTSLDNFELYLIKLYMIVMIILVYEFLINI